MMSWKQNLCKLHNEVFKAAESRINIACLPLAGGDESLFRYLYIAHVPSAPHRRGLITQWNIDEMNRGVCPS